MNGYDIFLLNTFGLSLRDSLIMVFLLFASFYIGTLLRKYQKAAFEKTFEKVTRLELLHRWMEVNLRTALVVYTKYSTNPKRIKASYLIDEETFDNLDFITNVRGARYISSSVAAVELDAVKSLLYLIDDNGISYVVLATSVFTPLGNNDTEEIIKANYIVNDIYVVEKNKISKLKEANIDNVLIINKNIEEINYTDYKSIIISISTENTAVTNNHINYMNFSIMDIDTGLTDYKQYDFKINLPKRNYFTNKEVAAPGDE